jgi:hypothetical protein
LPTDGRCSISGDEPAPALAERRDEDAAGGLFFDLYLIWWFDDVAHFLNWWILVWAVALALRRTSLGRLPVMKLGSSGLH